MKLKEEYAETHVNFYKKESWYEGFLKGWDACRMALAEKTSHGSEWCEKTKSYKLLDFRTFGDEEI